MGEYISLNDYKLINGSLLTAAAPVAVFPPP